MVSGVVVILAATALTWHFLWRWIAGLDLGSDPAVKDRAVARLDAAKVAVSVGVGLGGVAALYLAARRQRTQELELEARHAELAHTRHDAEASRITELYTKASDQLGSETAPVRLAGIYALERLAQDNVSQRQTVVNVLCAYLRMPYEVPGSAPDDDASPQARAEYAKQVQELQVRLTAQRILADHARLEPEGGTGGQFFWDDLDLDLSDATLIDFSMADCRVRDIRFVRTMFFGASRFTGTTFTGNAWFGTTTTKGCATFKGSTDFTCTTFAKEAHFDSVRFAHDAHFWGAIFEGDTYFNRANFTSQAWFTRQKSHPPARFKRLASFGNAEFEGPSSFDGVKFAGAARFSGAPFAFDAHFRGAIFKQDSELNGIKFEEGVDFSEAIFEGRADLASTRFGGTVSFRHAKFSQGASLHGTHVAHPAPETAWPPGWRPSAKHAVRGTLPGTWHTFEQTGNAAATSDS
jgi:uncharacterized protein YjbI with pentapeptide repeats